MKPYAFLALIVAITGFMSVVLVVEAPRKPKNSDRAYVLPKVEDMPKAANPLQF